MKKSVLFLFVLMAPALFVNAQHDSVQTSMVDSYFSEITLYPNPTERYININVVMEADQSVTLRIFNLMGKLELEKEFNPLQDPTLKLDLLDLEKGLYFVSIESGENKTTKRIYVI